MELKEMFSDKKGKLMKNVFIAVLFGILLILTGDIISGSNKKEADTETAEIPMNENSYITELETKTKEILSKVSGAGNVEVMITLSDSGESVYAQENKTSSSQTDESASQGDMRGIASETEESTVVTVNNGDGSTSPVVIKEMTAEISGIVIVAEGGDDVIVKNSLISAAQALFDVSANKVEVFKMG